MGGVGDGWTMPEARTRYAFKPRAPRSITRTCDTTAVEEEEEECVIHEIGTSGEVRGIGRANCCPPCNDG